MNTGLRAFAFFIFSLTLILNVGCAPAAEEDDDASTAPFTATEIEKTWNSSCMAGIDPISNATHHKFQLRLMTGGTYRSYDTWYTSSTCSPVGYVADYVTNGTYTVGAVVSGTAQAIDFIATSSTVMPFTVQFQTDMNSDCGGSSPFSGNAVVGNNGGTFSTYMITCMSAPFPNSGDNDFNNIATFSGGVLSLGSPEFGVPGVFFGTTLPTSANVVYY